MSRLEELKHKIDTLTLREAALGYALTPLTFAPSTKYTYSNAGINTAGRIIEVVSGMPYEKFMERRLFEPLGMKDTTMWPRGEQLKRLAKSYAPAEDGAGLKEIQIDQLSYPLDDPRRGPSPAGGYFSTAADVALFGRMILAGGVYNGRRYVSESAIRQMTATQTGDILNQGKGEGGYGLGWSTERKLRGGEGGGHGAVNGPCGHGGAYSTQLWIDPQRGLVLVFMVQHNGFPGKAGAKIFPGFKKAALAAFGK
jgi:CubicO group peptidase (beta-lactamase class C family)